MSPEPAALAPAHRRWGEAVLRAVFVVAFIYLCSDFLVPIFLGSVLAVMLFPLHARLRVALGRFSRMSPGIMTTGALLVLAGPITLLGWKAGEAAVDVFSGTSLQGAIGFVEGQMQRFAHFVGMDAQDLALVRTSVGDAVSSISATIGRGLATALKTLPGYFTDLFLFTLANYYALRDGESFIAWLRRISPADPEEFEALLRGMQRAIRGAVMGMLVVGGLQGGLCMIVMAALQVPGAVLWGVLAMLLSVVPFVGTTPVTVGACVYLLAMDRPMAAGGMLITAGVVGIIDNVIRPYMQSTHDEIHPLVAILSIFGGLLVLGLPGLFIGPVVAAMALWAIGTWRGPAVVEAA